MKIIANVRSVSPVGLAVLTTLLMAPTPALSQAFDASPTTQAGGITYNRATPGIETVTVNVGSSFVPAEIRWVPNSATFLPAGNTATFVGGVGNPAFGVVNFIDPTGAPNVIFAGSLVGGPAGSFAEVTFETSPGEGIIVAAGASVDATRLVLRANLVTIQAGASFTAGTGLSIDGDLFLSGAVQIGNGEPFFGELTGNAFLLGGTLTFNRADNYTYGGQITGNGSIVQDGVGILTLSNAGNAYTGSTTIRQGNLVSAGAIPDTSNTSVFHLAALVLAASDVINSLSGAGSAGGDGNGNRTLTVGAWDGGASFVGVLSDLAPGFVGAGQLSFAKIGQGRQTLSGSNTYTGSTTVSDGTLVVNGSIASSSSLTVDAGATLGGNGFVPAATINGTLAPGNSIGTITIAGNLSFGAGSTYAVEVSPAAADLTNVTGTANLSGGAVAASFGAGTYSNRRYTILTATGGLGGTTFTGINDNAPGVNTSLAYDGNSVYLDTELVLAEMPQGPGGPPLNPNQRAVARAVDAYLAANGSVPAAFAILDANGLTQISGEIATASMSAGMDAAGQFLGALSDPFMTNAGTATVPAAATPAAYSGRPAALSSHRALAALSGETVAAADAANAALSMSSAHAADAIAGDARWKLWGTVYGAGLKIGGDPAVGSADFSSRNWGVATGFGRDWGDGAGGLALGGAGSSFDLAGGLGSGSAGTFNAGLYAGQNFGNAYLSGALAYGWHNTRTTRAVPGDILTGRFNAHTFSGRIEAGYRIDTAFATVTPYAGVQATSYTLPAYVETSAAGGAFAVAHARQSEVFARTELGLKAEHAIPTSSATIKLSGRVAWGYNAANDRSVTAAFVALPGQSFTITGARPDRHAALIDLGIEAAFASGLAAKLSFSGEFSGNVASYGAAAKLSYRW